MKNIILASLLLCVLVVSGSASAELTGMDIGITWPPNPAGSLTIDTPNSNYTVQAAGRDIWDNADSFHYAYQPILVTGDFEAIVRVDSLLWLHDPLNAPDWGKAGIMARANLTEDSAHAMVCRSGHNGVHLQARQVNGRHSIYKDLGSGDVFGSPIWIKLARKGNVFAASWAQDIAGSPGPWQNPSITWIDMPASAFLGLATTSHLNTPPNNVVNAIYRNFSIGPLSDFPPIPNFGPFPGPEGGHEYMGIREVIDNGDILNQDDCNNSLTSGSGTIVNYTAPVLNIQDYGSIGNFGGDNVFGVVTAGHRLYGSVDHISMVVKGIIEIPAGGEYTFCLNSDDGFTLQFPGHDFTGISGGGEIVPFTNGSALQFWDARGFADTLGVINLTAGDHPFVLTYHEGVSGAEVEFSAAPGERTLFSDDFLLVGSGETIPAKPPVPNPPSINNGVGFRVTMVYEPYTTGPNYSDELDSAIANVEAAWAETLPIPNVVVTAIANWLNFKDPEYYAGGKGFPQQPFPGSEDGLDNNHFAMGSGEKSISTLPDVAVCGADYGLGLTDVQSKLLGTGLFNSVSTINVAAVTPTLAQLQAFDAVLVYSYYGYNNSVALGDVMADYVDSGGGVVTAVFEGLSGYNMQGRWLSGGYRVLLFTTWKGGLATLGTVHYPSHLTMRGVSSFSGGSGSFRPAETTLSSGATLIAGWSDGMPLVAVKDIGGTNRVDLGFFPTSSDVSSDCWDSTTDGDLLMANALLYVSGPVTDKMTLSAGKSVFAASETISIEFADPEGTSSKGPGVFITQTLPDSINLNGINTTIVVEPESPISGSVLSILDSIPIAYDFVHTSDLSTIDFSPYNTIILGMDGGAVEEADMAHLATYVNAGARLILLGGSNYSPFAQGLNDNFIQINVASYSWATVSGVPDLTVVNSAHLLAAGLPANYDFVNSGASYYMARITDGMATVVAENGDGYPSLVHKLIGSGELIYFINSPTESYWTDAGDYAILQKVLLNALLMRTTEMNIYEEGDYTFLILADDSSQFRILDLAGGDPYAWTINDHEIPELVRLPDGTGFRFNGCCVDVKGTVHLTPGDYRIQIMFNESTGHSYFGLWSSKDGSQIFLLGDTTSVPGYPQINALELACPYYLIGDENHDCKVNFLDISLIALNWLTDCTMNPADPACIPK